MLICYHLQMLHITSPCSLLLSLLILFKIRLLILTSNFSLIHFIGSGFEKFYFTVVSTLNMRSTVLTNFKHTIHFLSAVKYNDSVVQ